MMRRAIVFSFTVLLLASCGSMGNGGSLGDIILGSPSSTQSSDVQGYVNSVDTRNQLINLDVTYVNNLRQSGSNTNQRGTIYYDSRTRVLYNNREYNVTDLERGDQISVRGYNDNGRYVAEQIDVVRDVRQ
jgi:hypothetical protein